MWGGFFYAGEREKMTRRRWREARESEQPTQEIRQHQRFVQHGHSLPNRQSFFSFFQK